MSNKYKCACVNGIMVPSVDDVEKAIQQGGGGGTEYKAGTNIVIDNDKHIISTEDILTNYGFFCTPNEMGDKGSIIAYHSDMVVQGGCLKVMGEGDVAGEIDFTGAKTIKVPTLEIDKTAGTIDYDDFIKLENNDISRIRNKLNHRLYTFGGRDDVYIYYVSPTNLGVSYIKIERFPSIPSTIVRNYKVVDNAIDCTITIPNDTLTGIISENDYNKLMTNKAISQIMRGSSSFIYNGANAGGDYVFFTSATIDRIIEIQISTEERNHVYEINRVEPLTREEYPEIINPVDIFSAVKVGTFNDSGATLTIDEDAYYNVAFYPTNENGSQARLEWNNGTMNIVDITETIKYRKVTEGRYLKAGTVAKATFTNCNTVELWKFYPISQSPASKVETTQETKQYKTGDMSVDDITSKSKLKTY